jgi:Uma2 family endonuclease
MATFTEYLRYQAPPGSRDELIHGEIVLSPSPNRRHQDICTQIYDLLKAIISRDYVVRLDTTVNLGISEGPRPDVFVIDRKRWVAADEHDGFPQGSPQLVVEVKSKSNSWPELLAKKDLFLSDPQCLAVWLVDSEKYRVHVHSREGDSLLETEMLIEIPDPLGKGRIKVADIFNGIIEE